MQNRRDFLTHTALAGAGIAIGLPAAARDAFSVAMAASPLAAGAHLTPILAVDDALRLSLLDRALNEDVKAVMIAHHGFYQSSGVLAREEDDVLTLLGTIREKWAGRDRLPVERHEYNGDMLEPKLAFVTGWLAHQAVQQHIYGDEAHPGIDEKAVYHDVTLCHSIFKSEPVSQDARKPTVDELAHLLEMMYLRTYVRMHTIDPDFDDVENWIIRYVKWSEDTRALTRNYARAYLEPDAEKVQRYVNRPNFYDASNPLIVLARDLQQGITETTIDLAEAMQVARGQSQYARALAGACARIQAVGAFMDGVADQAALKKTLQEI